MWSAPNFLLLSEVSYVCWEFSENFIAKGEALQRFGEDVVADDNFVGRFSTWLFLSYVNSVQGSIFATLANGNPVRLSRLVTEPYFEIDPKFPTSPQAKKHFDRHSFDPFPAIDPYHYFLSLRRRTERIERLLGSEVIQILEPLEGMPVCVERTNSLIGDLEGIALTKPVEVTLRKSGGRTKVRNHAVKLFTQRYPQGLAEVSINHAAKVLGYDRKTLREGLREAGLYGERDGE